MGLIAIAGPIVPLRIQHQGELISRSRVVLMLGIAIMLAGLAGRHCRPGYTSWRSQQIARRFYVTNARCFEAEAGAGPNELGGRLESGWQLRRSKHEKSKHRSRPDTHSSVVRT